MGEYAEEEYYEEPELDDAAETEGYPFEQALIWMKAGKKVWNLEWDYGRYIFLADDGQVVHFHPGLGEKKDPVIYAQYLTMRGWQLYEGQDSPAGR